MRHTAAHGRSPSTTGTNGAGADEAREPTESATVAGRRVSSFCHDEPDDHGRVGRLSTWSHRRRISGAYAWSTDAAPSVPVTSRERTAWMLAHVPEYTRQYVDSEVDGRDRDRFDTWRQEVDKSLVDPPRPRTTMASRSSATDARHWAQLHSQPHLTPSVDTDSSARGLHEPQAPPQRHSARYPGEQSGYWKERESGYFDNQSGAHARGFDATPSRGGRDGYLSADTNSEVDSVAAVQDVDSETTAEPNVPKTSRYLREMDRRAILERLAQGEKQAPLAKEYNVSRAAISNLYKHRHTILARTDEDPFAKHPKKKTRTKSKPRSQRSHSLSALEDGVDDDGTQPNQSSTVSNPALPLSASSASADTRASRASLQLTKSRALQILLSTMGDATRSTQNFRRTSERALWLLLEEALASVPLDTSDTASERSDAYPSFAVLCPPCAITMEPDTLNATPMLDIFQLIQPQQPCGIVTVATHRDALTVEISGEEGDRLPSSLRAYNVFLLDVVAASGEIVCAAIEKLLGGFGVLEANVSIVALFTSSEVVAMVQCKYPLAKIVTARIDSSITRRRIASTHVDVTVQRMREAYSVAL